MPEYEVCSKTKAAKNSFKLRLLITLKSTAVCPEVNVNDMNLMTSGQPCYKGPRKPVMYCNFMPLRYNFFFNIMIVSRVNVYVLLVVKIQCIQP